MPSADLVLPTHMSRVAVVAPKARVRAALVALARAGCVELVGNLPPAEGEEAEALRRLTRRAPATPAVPAILASAPEVAALERSGERDLLAGEVELKQRAGLAVEHGSFSAWLGWAPTAEIGQLNDHLSTGRFGDRRAAPARLGGPAHALPAGRRRAAIPPARADIRNRPLPRHRSDGVHGDLLHRHVRDDVRRRRPRPRACPARSLAPRAAARTPRRLPAVLGDPVRRWDRGCMRRPALRRGIRPDGPHPARLWLDPLERPVPLLLVAVGVGAVLLLVSYLLGIVNRWRDDGFGSALLAQYGIAGLAIFVGVLFLPAASTGTASRRRPSAA